jgi:aryl-alcohol dehydrogenase-like predicted oxidoreductase
MNASIALRRLGQSELMVTPIGLGCWQFSKKSNFAGKFWSFIDDDMIRMIVQNSLEGGINWFDTAELYGNGVSERSLSVALTSLGKHPGDVIVATKWWPMFRTAGNILNTIGERIDSLHPFPIDLYQVHQPYSFSSETREMEAMAKLVSDGKIRYIGISNFSAEKMRSAWNRLKELGLPLVSNQVRYNLIDRRIESNGILRTAKELGISIIAYSPLGQGILTGKFHDQPELLKNIGMRKYSSPFRSEGLEKSRPLIGLLKELAKKYSVSPSQVALNWLIHFQGDTVVAIPGASRDSHVRENTGAMNFRLSDEDMVAIDRASAIFK